MLSLYGCEHYRYLRRTRGDTSDASQVAECSELFATADRVILAITAPPRQDVSVPRTKRKHVDAMEYVLAPSADAAVALVCQTSPADRCFFFLIEPSRPVYAYIDFDAPRAAFASYRSFRTMVLDAVGAFCRFVEALYCRKTDCQWQLFEACTDVKWSMHAHSTLVFESVATLGDVVRRFVDAARADLRYVNPRLAPLFAGDACFLDTSVCTSRPFRLPWCCKARGVANHLRPLAPAAAMADDVAAGFIHPTTAAAAPIVALGAPDAMMKAALPLGDLEPPTTWEAVSLAADRCARAAFPQWQHDTPLLQMLFDAELTPGGVLRWLAESSAHRAAWLCAMYALCHFCVGASGTLPDATAVTLAAEAYKFCASDARDRIATAQWATGAADDVGAPRLAATLYLPQLYGALLLCAVAGPYDSAAATDAEALAALADFVAMRGVSFSQAPDATERTVRHLMCVPLCFRQLSLLAVFKADARHETHPAPTFLAVRR